MSNHVLGENIEFIVDHFEALNTKMRCVGIIREVRKINKKLLNSLSYTWNSNVTNIKDKEHA